MNQAFADSLLGQWHPSLRKRIASGTAVIGVIGLGYVGLPLAHALHGGGLPIIGFDVDQRKIDCIDRKENYLKHLGDDMISTLSESKKFSATTSFDRLVECDVSHHLCPDTTRQSPGARSLLHHRYSEANR